MDCPYGSWTPCVQPYCLWTHGKTLWSLLCVQLVHEAGDYFHPLHSATLLTQVISSVWIREQMSSGHWTLSVFLCTPCAFVSNFNMDCNFLTISRLIYIVFSAVLVKPAASQYLLFNFNLAQTFFHFWPLQLTNHWFSHKCCASASAEFMFSCMKVFKSAFCSKLWICMPPVWFSRLKPSCLKLGIQLKSNVNLHKWGLQEDESDWV